MPFQQRLGHDVLRRIQDRVRRSLARSELDALLTDDPDDVAYLTGFFHHPCERPVIAYLPVDGEVRLLVPRLEREHAEWQRVAASVVDYPEFPGTVEPISRLAGAVPAAARLGVPASMSIGRLALVEGCFPRAHVTPSYAVTRARWVKEPEEVALHREAGRITDVMLHRGIDLVTDALRSGGALPSEAELAAYVGSVGAGIMDAEHEDVVVAGFRAGGLVYSGPNSARPHGLPSTHRLQPGETFMLSLGCAVGGRYIEGERTFLLGEPSADQRRYYEAVRSAQAAGAQALRPGVTCAEANRTCLQVIRDAGLGPYLQHRMGHGIGVGMHESPWLEDGDETVLEEGFVVSDEPGIYVTGHAGYRVSDSMLVTADGAQALTTYPRSLDDIVVTA
ncbi:Xaa-Pro peptidase family protein [Terrabacter aeriphilus]|uniref:Xaa-Pro peptidase family protein n=1 Tax=Terrabacter aeriphilus TaxID=515662 RepID=A0ABP9J2J1_9MICO